MYTPNLALYVPTLFHVLGHFVGEGVACAPCLLVAGVDPCLAVCEMPNVLVETPEFPGHAQESLGIVDYGLYLAWRMDHAFCRKDAMDVFVGERCHPLGIKISKALAEYLATLEHHQP